MSQTIQMSDSFATGALLALAGGFLDAYTYICRGGVFANAQTGNIVLFGVKLAELQWRESLAYLLPIAAFFLGIFFAEMVKHRFREQSRVHWRQIILGVELLILLLVARLPERQNLLANTLVSFICSIQVESFRKVRGNPYATTMCTGNLRSATERLYLYRLSHDRNQLRRSLEYYGVIGFFIIGAVAGAVFSHLLGLKAVLLVCIFLLAAFFLMFKPVYVQAD